MKMIMRKTLLGLSVVILLGSCATYQGALSSNAVIIDNKFRVIGVAVGESQSEKILGLGGLSRNAMVFEAKQNLYQQVKLLPGQALTNITVDFKNEFYFVYFRTKVTVTGEIIDFNGPDENADKNTYSIQNRLGFEVGELVFVNIKGQYQQRKIAFLGFKLLSVESATGDVAGLSLDFPYEQVFHTKGSFNYRKKSYSVGEKIEVDQATENTTLTFKGKVVGIRKSYALIVSENGETYKQIETDM